MRLLGIVCSPRKGGNTEILVKEALKPAEEAGWETELFSMSEKQVAPCDGCLACFKTGSCAIKDDMQELYQMLEQADGVIIGSPVYFQNVSAQAKAVMDRTFALAIKRALKDKVAGAILTARRVGAAQARSMIYSFCITHGMIVAGAGVGYGMNPGDVLQGAGAISSTATGEARQLGIRIVRLAERLSKSKE